MFFQKIALRSWHRFLLDFGANMLPFFLQKSTKILPKIDSKMHQFFDQFLHRFLESTCFHFPPPDPPKSHLELVLKCIGYHIDFNIVFFNDFEEFLGANMGPKRRSAGAGETQSGPRKPQRRPKTPQGSQDGPKTAPRCAQDAPRTLPGRLKTPPLKLDLRSSWGRFWEVWCFGWF